jgi:hypothetical protein
MSEALIVLYTAADILIGRLIFVGIFGLYFGDMLFIKQFV